MVNEVEIREHLESFKDSALQTRKLLEGGMFKQDALKQFMSDHYQRCSARANILAWVLEEEMPFGDFSAENQ